MTDEMSMTAAQQSKRFANLTLDGLDGSHETKIENDNPLDLDEKWRQK
jgi:hypothetical protein